jgi:hypothetical protein
MYNETAIAKKKRVGSSIVMGNLSTGQYFIRLVAEIVTISTAFIL